MSDGCTLWIPWLCLGAAAATACASEPDRPLVRGRWVDVETDPEIEICGGQIEIYDLFAEEVPGLFGASLPVTFNGRLHAFTEASREETPAASGMLEGVAASDDAWFFHQRSALHELSHLLVWSSIGVSTRVLCEGAATATNPDWLALNVGAPEMSVTGLLTTADEDSFDGFGYREAAKFVRYVVDTHGPDAYRELHQALAEVENPAERLPIAEAVLAASIDAIEADYAAEKRCGYQLPYCGEVFPTRALPLEIDARVDCEAPETLGYLGPDPERFVPYRVLAFSIEEPTALQYSNPRR